MRYLWRIKMKTLFIQVMLEYDLYIYTQVCMMEIIFIYTSIYILYIYLKTKYVFLSTHFYSNSVKTNKYAWWNKYFQKIHTWSGISTPNDLEIDLVTSETIGYFRSPKPPDFLSVWTHARWENCSRNSIQQIKIDKDNCTYHKDRNKTHS